MQILLRLYGWEPDSPVPIFPLSFNSAGSLLVAVLAVALFSHARARLGDFDRKRFFLLISPMFIPTLWFELLNNHTQTHSHFTYRSESAAIAIFFAAFLMATPGEVSLRSLFATLWSSKRVSRPA